MRNPNENELFAFSETWDIGYDDSSQLVSARWSHAVAGRSVGGQLSHDVVYPVDVEFDSWEDGRFDWTLTTWPRTQTHDAHCDPPPAEITTHEWTSTVALTTSQPLLTYFTPQPAASRRQHDTRTRTLQINVCCVIDRNQHDDNSHNGQQLYVKVFIIVIRGSNSPTCQTLVAQICGWRLQLRQQHVCACTNNDVDGWQRRLNTLLRHGRLIIYQLPQLLFDERQFVQMQARLLSEDKLRSQRRRQYEDINGKWTHCGTTTTSSLCAPLAACSIHDAENRAGLWHSRLRS